LEVDEQDYCFQKDGAIYSTYSKFNNADVKHILWWSFNFSKLAAPLITRSIATVLLSADVFKG
jgi:hypothetical protein